MVGLVIVSHSQRLAEGVVELARQMASSELLLEAAGGLDEPGVLGTDAGRVIDAVSRAMSADGVLVLMDLGSALMSAEMAVEMLGSLEGPVRLTAAPLVEGAVAAAVAASGGASLDEVAAEARGALAMKVSQIDEDADSGGVGATAGAGTPEKVDAQAELAVRNEIGLHARPAARFVETVRRFDAQVYVAKVGGAAGPVNASSLTNLVALGVRRGDTLLVTASGGEAQAVVDSLVELAGDGFGDGLSDAPVSIRESPAAREVRPPIPSSAPADGTVLKGVAASAGVAAGSAFVLRGAGSPPAERAAGSVDDELSLLERGRGVARLAIERDREALRGRAGAAEAAIFDAHLALLDDDALLSPAREAIDGGATAEQAWHDAAASVAEIYRGLDEPLLRERATDVLDVGRRLVAALTGGDASEDSPAGIVVADELTPADTAGLDPERVLGIATARGSTTAHAAIIARSLGLPAVVGLGAAVLGIEAGTSLLLDGEAGTVLVAPSESEAAAARERRARQRERAAAALARAAEPAWLRSGEPIEVFANIGNVRDAERAVAAGAEGVGLLRTEFLFLDRPSLPDEEEQTETLREIARTLGGRPLVMRTLDAGADKPLPALPMPPEQNPFLGVRGIRLTLVRPELLATQLRAALRVAAEYPLKVMLPMVATLDEILQARAMLEQARADTGIGAALELGIMVEVPAAALAAERLAAHVDFFSLGTNDLTQYTMAAERGDARLAPLLATPQPAVLRLIKATVEGGATHGAWTGVCGEMAGDPASAVLLAGLGVSELSMSPGLIPEVKEALRAVTLGAAREAAEKALNVDSANEARALALALL